MSTDERHLALIGASHGRQCVYPPGSQSEIDTTRAHTARIWNYWLGGRDNYAIDCEVGDQIRQFHPDIGNYARADRLFLGRAVRYLAGEAGIRQFLDIGTG
ncbi:MAG: SAM-dependent methyltransferase, partial [Pseudonocardiaceae bacterium]